MKEQRRWKHFGRCSNHTVVLFPIGGGHIDRYRKRHAAKRTDALTVAWEELEPFLPAASTPEQEMDSRQVTIILNQFLGTLSQQDRLIFLRRYWFMDSYQEIALLAGLREKTLSVRLTRIRRKLKIYLQENEVYL